AHREAAAAATPPACRTSPGGARPRRGRRRRARSRTRVPAYAASLRGGALDAHRPARWARESDDGAADLTTTNDRASEAGMCPPHRSVAFPSVALRSVVVLHAASGT